MGDALDDALAAIEIPRAEAVELPGDRIMLTPIYAAKGHALFLELGPAYDAATRTKVLDVGDTLTLYTPNGLVLKVVIERGKPPVVSDL